MIPLTRLYDIVNSFMKGSTIVHAFNFSSPDMIQERNKILFGRGTSETVFWMNCMHGRKGAKWEEIDGMYGANHDSEIGCRDRKKGHGIRGRDVELSSLMNVAKLLKLKLGMRKGCASYQQQSRHRDSADIRKRGGILKENGDASKRTNAALRRTQMPVKGRPYV
jgi:hypothetical protein